MTGMPSDRDTILSVVPAAGSVCPVSEALREAGFTVVEVTTGHEVLRHAADIPVLILLHGPLPDMEEGELQRRLDSHAGGSAIPVLKFEDPHAGADGGGEAAPAWATALRPAPSARRRPVTAAPSAVVMAARGLIRARETERMFSAFVESAADAVVLVDVAGTMLRVNAETERLFGYARGDLLGRPLEMLVPHGIRRDHGEHFRRFVADPRPRRMASGRQLLAAHADGSEFPVDIALSAIGSGPAMTVACAIRDIGELRRAEEALRQHARELEQVDRQKDQFLAALGHELRSPIGALRQIASILQREAHAAPERLQALRMFDRQVEHMRRLVDDLADASRVQFRSLDLRAEPLDLRTVVEAALETTAEDVRQRRHRVTTTMPRTPVAVQGDRTRLVQVVANLTTNAAKYTPAGGSIDLVLEAQAGWAVLRVTDDGEGIDPDMLKRIFERFVQAPCASRSEPAGLGLGLGLSLVKAWVERHGGSVEAESRGPGSGSTFTVRLPLASPA
jgi:PAS domain S-box-containing protein